MIRCLVIQAFTALHAITLCKAHTFHQKPFCWLFLLQTSQAFNKTFWTEIPAIKLSCSSTARMGIWWRYNSFIYLMILTSAWDMKCALATARQGGGCAKGQLFQWMPVMPGTTAMATTMRQSGLGQNRNHFKLNMVHNLTITVIEIQRCLFVQMNFFKIKKVLWKCNQ